VRPARWPAALAGFAIVVLGVYLVLGGLIAAFGSFPRLRWPSSSSLLAWILGGQALRAFSEEYYYRSLLLAETQRLAPRLGARGPAAARWAALIPTSMLFGLEHVALGPPWEGPLRAAVFTLGVGLLFGILMLVTENLPFVAGMHAFVNWLVLGGLPRFVDETGRAALPAGTYVGVALALAFVLAFVVQRRGLIGKRKASSGGA
jgi:membrane protease YdiL (CAAX protease family)